MGLRAGFAQIDLTPPLGTNIIGWLSMARAERVRDPLHARVAIVDDGLAPIAFVQLDLLSIRWTTVEAIRRRAAAVGLDPARVLVAATHTHAGPAVAWTGEVPRDDAYVAWLVDQVGRALRQASAALAPAELGCGQAFQFGVAHNRRIIQRDGTVRTHGRFDHPDALCFEGPVDPAVTVLAARAPGGPLLGALVNYTCHPTHHGRDGTISAGWPGELAARLRDQGCPVTLTFNGAAGNQHFSNPWPGGPTLSLEAIGATLAADAAQVIGSLTWREQVRLGARRRTIALPYREPTPEQVAGTVRGAQRFVDPGVYDRGMPALLERIRQRGTQPAEVQVLSLDEWDWVGLPAEYFCELGLQIKERAHPRRAVVVGYANGMVGYVAHRAAYDRGGYETTFISSSRVAPGAGEQLADCAVELLTSTDP